ncbi:phosphoribosylformimino-5-aminoimidazole carboxamide ribotide isomerase [Candidatus Sumerlaeota bacterium]|nr:phosphoribosylformimino-5-aminoimidazole carboxamide ribotide isomerase [Candidatus Sumerlaeota bacterium]
MFRPCIDLHEGRVKQIVGGTYRDDTKPLTRFESERPAAEFAEMYRRDGLRGGHVIMIGPGNEEAARAALQAFPGGLQIGGGITPENAAAWLDAGASHVIVTSYVFREGMIDRDRLQRLIETVGRSRLVLDLSCRKRDGHYYVVTNRWQKFSNTRVNHESLLSLGHCADEFLIHSVDVEGKQEGFDGELLSLLAAASPIPTTYAGGVRSLDDVRAFWRMCRGRLDLTVGSALDLFGGSLPYRDVVALDRELDKRKSRAL